MLCTKNTKPKSIFLGYLHSIIYYLLSVICALLSVLCYLYSKALPASLVLRRGRIDNVRFSQPARHKTLPLFIEGVRL